MLLNVCSRWLFIKYGYELGTNLVVKMKSSDIIDKFVEGATIVGMMVVGAMIVGFVNLKIGCVWVIGEKEIVLQDIINSLMPSLLPLLLVLSYYWILIKRKKGMYICIIASFVLGIAGKGGWTLLMNQANERILEQLKHKLIVSCQARVGWPMYGPEIMAAFAAAAQTGWSGRYSGPRARTIF